MSEREWTNRDLDKYLTVKKFTDDQRENVLKQLFESDLLSKFLATPEGRLILKHAVDNIRDYTMLIVSLAISADVDRHAKIDAAASKINTAFDFMNSIAKIAIGGEQLAESLKATRQA